MKLNGHLGGFPFFQQRTHENISLFHSFQQLPILSQTNYPQANVTHRREWVHFPKLLSKLCILKLPKKENWKNDNLEVGKKHELFQSSSLWYGEIFLLKCLHLTFSKLQSFQLLVFTVFMLKFSRFILVVFYQGEKPKMNGGGEEKKILLLVLSEVAQSCLTLWLPWTVAYQAPLSMEFSRQEYWSGLPFPSPWDLWDPGIKPKSPALLADALHLSHLK